MPQDSRALAKRVDEVDAALVIIDPLIEFIDRKVDSHKSQPLRQAVASLNDIARERGPSILVVFHLNKGSSTDLLLRQEGSGAFGQIVRGGMFLGKDPEDPDGEDTDDRVLAPLDTNLFKRPPSLIYEFKTAYVPSEVPGEGMSLTEATEAFLANLTSRSRLDSMEEASHRPAPQTSTCSPRLGASST